jgi:hypothetical protein
LVNVVSPRLHHLPPLIEPLSFNFQLALAPASVLFARDLQQATSPLHSEEQVASLCRRMTWMARGNSHLTGVRFSGFVLGRRSPLLPPLPSLQLAQRIRPA